MDFLQLLSRYEGRLVSVVAGEGTRLLGTLASVTHDAVRLVQVRITDQVEAGGWMDKMQMASDDHHVGPFWPEMIVSSHVVRTVCCLDDDILDVPVEIESQPLSTPEGSRNTNTELFSYDAIQLELGWKLIPMADATQGGDLLDRVRRCRDHLSRELGMPFPKIRVRDNVQLSTHAFRISVHGVTVINGDVHPDQCLAIETEITAEPIAGIHAIDPSFGLPGRWIEPTEREPAELRGYTVVDAGGVLSTAVTEALRRSAAELLTYDAAQTLLNQLRYTHPATVDSLVPAVIAYPQLHGVLRGLLMDGVSLVPLPRILESVGHHLTAGVSGDTLLAHVRIDLARQICEPHLDEHRQLATITFDSALTATVRAMLSDGADLAARPFWWRLAAVLKDHLHSPRQGRQRVLLVDPDLRASLRNVLHRMLPQVRLLTAAEIPWDVSLSPAATVTETAVESFEAANDDENGAAESFDTLPNLPR